MRKLITTCVWEEEIKHIISAGLPKWYSSKEHASTSEDARDMVSIPGLERSPQGGNDNPPQYSCLENSEDYEAWGLQSLGSQKLHITEGEHMHTKKN